MKRKNLRSAAHVPTKNPTSAKLNYVVGFDSQVR